MYTETHTHTQIHTHIQLTDPASLSLTHTHTPNLCLHSFCTDMGRVGVAPRCESRACNPRMGNLVLGRRVLTQTVCGYNGTELYCSYSDPPADRKSVV